VISQKTKRVQIGLELLCHMNLYALQMAHLPSNTKSSPATPTIYFRVKGLVFILLGFTNTTNSERILKQNKDLSKEHQSYKCILDSLLTEI